MCVSAVGVWNTASAELAKSHLNAGQYHSRRQTLKIDQTFFGMDNDNDLFWKLRQLIRQTNNQPTIQPSIVEITQLISCET